MKDTDAIDITSYQVRTFISWLLCPQCTVLLLSDEPNSARMHVIQAPMCSQSDRASMNTDIPSLLMTSFVLYSILVLPTFLIHTWNSALIFGFLFKANFNLSLYVKIFFLWYVGVSLKSSNHRSSTTSRITGEVTTSAPTPRMTGTPRIQRCRNPPSQWCRFLPACTCALRKPRALAPPTHTPLQHPKKVVFWEL